MESNKRLIFALVLSVVVLLGSNVIIKKYFYKAPALVQQPAEEESAAGGRVKQDATKQQQRPKTAVQPRRKTSALRPAIRAAEENVVIETKKYQVIFSPQGCIEHWRLKEYKAKTGRGGISEDPVDLAWGSDTGCLDQGYEVMPLKDGNGVSLWTEDEGVSVLKEFIFEEDKYGAVVRFKIINASPYTKDVSLLRWGPGIAETTQPREIAFTSYTGQEIKRYKAYKVKSTIKQGDVLWSGITGQYFAFVVFPGAGSQELVITEDDKKVCLESVVENIPPGATVSGDLKIYAGPRDYEKLKAEGQNLHLLINFGFFGAIGKVIFAILKWLYKITGNYGVAIILISVLIKIMLFPLSRKGLKSMGDMQKVQPQMEILKQKFKHDKEGLAKEQMELYKRMGVNPLGGCLPMILQLPIFFALFVVFRNAIELRQAPFIFWIKDLSAPDPFYVLPILMGITTFIQQKMTPKTGASQPAGMSYFMTIFLTFIFLKFQAGLVLYWLTNNVLSIIEQQIIKRKA